MKISTQTLTLAKNYGLERAVEMLIDAGWDAIDVSIVDLNDIPFVDGWEERAKRLRKLANDRGVTFDQAHAPFGGGFEKYTTTLVPLMPRVFEFCSILGIRDVVVHPVQNGKYYGRAEELFQYNLEFYRGLAPIAKKFGIRIAIENMWQRNRIGGYIVDDVLAPPEELCRMYDELADPDTFTVCLDLGHVALCNRDPEAAIRIVGKERLGCLHIHDVDYKDDLHTLPGCSKINWQEVCRALAEIGYEGNFNLEADNFFLGFLPEHHELCAKFMCDASRIFANKIEALKAEYK